MKCGCTPDASGFGWCTECRRKLKEKIWRKMSAEDKAYDRTFAPEQSQELDEATMDEGMPDEYNTGCSCHINPPCSYCVDEREKNERV